MTIDDIARSKVDHIFWDTRAIDLRTSWLIQAPSNITTRAIGNCTHWLMNYIPYIQGMNPQEICFGNQVTTKDAETLRNFFGKQVTTKDAETLRKNFVLGV